MGPLRPIIGSLWNVAMDYSFFYYFSLLSLYFDLVFFLFFFFFFFLEFVFAIR